MAYEFENEDWEDSNEYDWDETPAGLWDDVTDGQGWNDEYGKMLFDGVFVDPLDTDTRGQMYEALLDWFESEYGLDFEEVFDWEGWREWYG